MNKLAYFHEQMRTKHPDIPFEICTFPERISHSEAMQTMSKFIYFLCLSPMEGLSLMPLEAMACGYTFICFDGGGGADYLRDGINCVSTYYPDMEGLVDRAAIVLAGS